MNEKELRKLIREELKKVMFEIDNYPEKIKKESVISQIYQWIIKGEMKKAMEAMQNDPELLRLAKNVDDLKKELLKRMSNDEGMLKLISGAIQKIKQEKNIK